MRIASLLSNILLFRKFEKSLENYIYCHANLQIRYSYIQKDAGALKVQTLWGEFGRKASHHINACSFTVIKYFAVL